MMQIESPPLLILLAHGSRDPRWQAPFVALTESLQAELGKDRVALAYMEMAEPDLMTIAKQTLEDGTAHLKILPLFMAAGGHVSTDIPRLAQALRDELGMTVDVLPPIGEHPVIVDALKTVARESL